MLSKTSALQSSFAPNLVRNSGPILCVPLAEDSATTEFLKAAVILCVGLDPALSKTQIQTWESAGYRITSAGSIRDAIDHIRYGDFDLVLMGDSISLGDRERLTFLIRASGSRVPVVCVTDISSQGVSFADATVSNEPIRLLQCIGEVLAAQAGKAVASGATLGPIAEILIPLEPMTHNTSCTSPLFPASQRTKREIHIRQTATFEQDDDGWWTNRKIGEDNILGHGSTKKKALADLDRQVAGFMDFLKRTAS